jgi:hypothetical protein
MPINPSLERKLSSMKDEMKAIRDKHKENQSAQNDQVAGQLELIKNKREQMLAAAKKSAEIASRQNEELDVTMLVANMLAEGDAKKVPTGQGGRDYEEQINNILKKHGKADKDAKTAGSSADAPDAQFNHGGKKHNLEIKADSKAMFGQIELKHDGEKWDISEASKKKYPETYKAIHKSGFLKDVNKKWGKPTGDYNEDLKMGNVYKDHPNADPIKAHYGKDRKTDYIQIGKGHGFYHTGNDAAKLGSPELEGKTQFRARMKNRGTDKKTGKAKYGALIVMSLKDAPKSHHDLEKEVHKEWINYLLHGPQLVEATNVVAKPIEPGENENHHIIHMTVSKNGKRQVRKATVTTHHGEAHAIKKAYKHYEDSGYEVHGHKVMKELEQIEVPKLKKESVEEGYNHHDNRTGFAKRHREDDEYHVPDPVGRTHKIVHTVSKEGGEKHSRTVTITNSTKSHEEAKAAARAHLEKQGYKIHEATEQIDEAPKNHTIEAHGIKGMKGTPWRKTFKSHDHLNDWAEKNDSVEVHGTRELESAKKDVKEERVSKHKDLGATNATTHFVKNVTTGEVLSPHRGRHDAEEGLRAAEADGAKGHKFKIVRAVKEEVAANSVGGGAIAGTQGDAGKKSVMTKPPMKRQELKKFSFFVSQEHDK